MTTNFDVPKMAIKTTPLTNTEVKQAKPREKEYSLMDGHGLKLRVTPIGTKIWLYNFYRPHTGKRVNISLGTYPEVSLAEARQIRNNYRALLAKGIDPKEHRDSERQTQKNAHANTLENAAQIWFEIKKNNVTPAYSEDIWRSLLLHIFPAIGHIPIHKLEAPCVIEVLRPIAAKGSLETVKRLCQRLNEIMTHSVNTGLIKANPLTGIHHAFLSPQKQNMPTLKPNELPELMHTLTRANVRITTRCLIEWQLHTIARPTEAAGARWEEIDLENCLWRIPAERMKKKRPHTVPLTLSAVALLDVMRPISGGREFIFPADRNPNNHTNEQTANMAIKRMGFKGRLVAHGLRSLASTILNEQGFDSDIIESALAHVDKNEVRATYNRAEYIDRRRIMMNWWSDHIRRAATGDMSLCNHTKKLKLATR